MALAHERIDLRVWDHNYSGWTPLVPWATLQLDHRADLSIDTLTLTLSDKHPAMGRLRVHRDTPVPVTLGLNGVEWSGLVTGLTQTSDGKVTVTASSDDKHLHRLLARSREATAVDSEAADITGQVGTVLADLTASAAQRTGLPVYINVQHKGDMVKLPVKSEDTVASVVDPALKASDTFAAVRVLLPGMAVPDGQVTRVQGVAEGTWETDCINRGLWPNVTNPRVNRAAVMPPVAPTPHLSWFGTGSINRRGVAGGLTDGICWVPFITSDTERGYWQDGDTDVRVATKEELWGARRTGWHEHLTEWAAGTFKKGRGDVKLLGKCATAGLLTKPSGAKLTSESAAFSYIGAGAANAWWTGTAWVLADTTDFNTEDKKRQPSPSSRVTPGILVQTRGVRDRRHIVFSSTPGGGLESWETSTSSPEAAMVHASAQLDETVLKALQAGTMTASSQIERLDPGQMKQVIGAVNNVPEVVEALDVSAQPFATISGTDLAYSRVGAKVNLGAAGPFFYREMTMNLGNAGANPVGEMGREWAKAQGSTTLTLTPGYGTACVFGDDVKHDGRVIPGWKPGDRVSFVDGETRMSEIIAGYSLTKNWDGPLTVTPVLGRADNGVMDNLLNRVRKAEEDSRKALTQAPRRVPMQEVDERAEKYADKAREAAEKNIETSALTPLRHQVESQASKLSKTDDYARTGIWLSGAGKELLDAKQRYDRDLEAISKTLGGPSNVQAAFANELWLLDERMLREMRAEGLTIPPKNAPMSQQYRQVNTALWQNQKRIDERQDEFARETRRLSDTANEAVSLEEKYRTRFAFGEPKSEEIINYDLGFAKPTGRFTASRQDMSEWFYVYSYRRQTEVQLKKPARGYVLILQNMGSGLVDFQPYIVNHAAGALLPTTTGGLTQDVRSWMVIYQLYDWQ